MFKHCNGCVCTTQARVDDSSSLLDAASLVVCHHVMLAIHGELRAFTGSTPFSSEHRFLTSASLHSSRTFLAHQWPLGTSVGTSAGTIAPVNGPRTNTDSTESSVESTKWKCTTMSTGSFTVFATPLAVALFNDRSDADNSISGSSAENPSLDLVGGECAPRRQLWFGGGGESVGGSSRASGVLSIIRSGRQKSQRNRLATDSAWVSFL
ncbi:hypothetical protein BGZ60DRAFT_526984 [Tricladium varicosporioides]|nr:hypothetical protein BGZ60DRAFT_526984 [Hymenoscyphus varicosporioides]